ncbi:hypothetical protein BBBOND_0310870 [Babesia bigemina]|uniref:Ribosome-binding protein 1 n=1 Tax=Babesia bigemina TaxID=5866 RepID=A0A061DD85_BABBI|nr:hypothetical protein BBBOND_0310870 [Babesia bigemina]CDR97184.1 hypothetical protein BBBOND_0310870 [Babesia bigemina]|eukprot:XP_012769370.1 hypothetical protein BBBOND_0310870 [Babesia bigemina]
MPSGKVPEFKTLKECLEFLQWLHDDKHMQYRVTRRLKKLLEKKYEKIHEQQMDAALSTFLSRVSEFHTKLCQKTGHGTYTPDKARDAFYALLQCIPKFLSVMYFIRYNVDPNFAGVGGGRWAEQEVGTLALYARINSQLVERMKSTAKDIEKYLIAESDDDYGGMMPGGFGAGELMPDYQGHYSQGLKMASDLIKICEKENHQLFRDVFVTSVLSKNSGVDVSNVANALRMVQDFCGLFEKVTDGEDFKGHVQSRNKCINWGELQRHCAKLKDSLSKLFTNNQFSFTGYGRTYDFLDKQNIAKKMASWLKKNLPEMKNILAQIQPLNSKYKKTDLKRKAILTRYYIDLGAHLTKYLFPYGFTFDGRSFKTGTTPYEDLKTHWDAVIGELKKDDGGLATLKNILDGDQCANGERKKESKPKLKPDTEPESDLGFEPKAETEPELENDIDSDVDSDEELMNQLSDDESEATKTEAAKPVVTKAEAPKPTPTKQEGAQNQGKKAEGAQNQGKKAEGDQGNGHSVGNTSSSPVTQAVQSQPSSSSSLDSASPGAPGTSSGQDSGAQATSPLSTQQSSGGSHRDDNADASSSPGGGGAGGSGQPPSVKKCLEPTMATFLNIGDTENSNQFCNKVYKKPTTTNYKYDTISEQLWEEYKKREILQPWEEKIAKRKREKEDKEREKEEQRQLQREAMLPEIDVVHKRQESDKSDNAYIEALHNQMRNATPSMPLLITLPPKNDVNSYDNADVFDADQSVTLNIDKPDVLGGGYPALFTIEQRPLVNAEDESYSIDGQVVGVDDSQLAFPVDGEEVKEKIGDEEGGLDDDKAVVIDGTMVSDADHAIFRHDGQIVVNIRGNEVTEKRDKQNEEERRLQLLHQTHHDHAKSLDGQPVPDPTDLILRQQEVTNMRRAYKEEEKRQRMKNQELKNARCS